MAAKIVLFVAVAALVHSQASGQLFGGFSPLPMGGYSETIGFKGDSLSGSLYQEHNFPHFPSPVTFKGGSDFLSQEHNFPHFSSPITFKGGADFLNSEGHGLTGNVRLESGIGGEGSLKGIFPIVDNPIHKVDGFAQIDRNLNANLNPVGPETQAFGVNYKNADGATASFSQTQTHGNPASKTIEASIPLVNSESHLLKLTGQNNIGQQQSLGVSYENKDNGATASLTGTQNNVGPARGTAAASIPVGNIGPAAVTVEGQSTFGHDMKPDNQVGVKVSIPLD